jgi:hypothetical protein
MGTIMILMKRASTAIAALMLVALAVFVLVPMLNEATSRAVSASIGSLRARVEGALGLSLSFDALSPSILRSVAFTQLAISSPAGRKILTARKVRVVYDILAVLRGKGSEAFSGLELEDAAIDLSLPEDEAVMDRLAAFFGAGGGGGSMPKISISGKDLALRLTLEGSGILTFQARSASFSTARNEPSVSLDGSFSFESAVPGSGPISGPISVSGSLSRDFKKARLALSVAAESKDFSLSMQRFELVFGDGKLALTKVKDRAPVDAAVRVDFGGGESSVALLMDGFAPSSSLRLYGRYSSLEPWLEMPYEGSLSIRAPGSDLSKVRFEARLSGYLPPGFLPGHRPGARMELAVRGDAKSMEVEKARVELGGDSVEYAGSFRFDDLSPDGILDVRLSLADGSLDVSSSVKLIGHGGEYAAFADQVLVGGTVFKDIALTASRKGEHADFKLSLRPPGPEAGGADPSISLFSGEAGAVADTSLVSCEGSVSFGSNPDLELSVDFEALDMEPLRPILAVLLESPQALVIVSSLKLGGSLFASSDFRRFSWSAPDLTVVSSSAPGAFALLSLSGASTTISVKRALVSGAGYSVEGSGKIDLSEAGRLAFEANLSFKDISYAMKGAISGQTLFITGDYGLEITARTADKDSYVSAKARGLPIPLGGGLFLATVDAEGRFASLQDWHLSMADFSLVPTGEKLAVLPEMSLAGDFGPTEAELGKLRIADKFSTLSGSATIAYSLATSPVVHLSARLSAPGGVKVAAPPESYAIDASYSGGRFEGVVDMVASPLARFGKPPVDGSADGRIVVKGDLADPSVDFDLALRDGRYLDQTLALAAAGSYNAKGLSLHDLKAAYQGQAISNGAATFVFADASATVSLDFSGTLGGDSLKFSLAAQGVSTKAGASLGEMLANYVANGSLIGFAVGAAPPAVWPFSASADRRSVSFVGGNSGELRFKYAAGGSFSASLRAPFPVRAEVSCLYDGKNIDLSIQGLEFDLGLLEPLMPSTLIKIVSGKAKGGFRAVGLANDPEISGEVDLEDASLKVLGWLADVAGPFNGSIIAEGRKVGITVPSIPAGKAAIALECQAIFDHWIPAGLTASLKTLEGSKVRVDSVILGIHAQGEAAADLKFALEGDVLAINCAIFLDKGTVVVTPATWAQSSTDSGRPQSFLSVDADVRFGRGVQVFFPSLNVPAVMGYSDPSSLLAIRYDQASDDFTLKGNVALRGGQVFYIQRDFFLKNGRIVFNEGRDHFDPRVTLLAELRDRINEAPVLITLQADDSPISSFQPKLSSDPPMSEQQIALLMGQNLVGASPNGTYIVAGPDSIKNAVISMGDLFVPQLNVTRLFEDKVRDAFGLDMFYFRTQVLQNWLIDLSGSSQTVAGDPLSRYFDQTELFAGKYLADSIFSHASVSLISNPLAGSNTLTLNSDLGVDLEVGVEMDSPFGIFQWNVAPTSWNGQFIIEQSLSLSWRLSY